MAVPKRKTSKARSSRRSAFFERNPPSLVECPQCHELKLSHYICPTCGHYKGKQVLKIE